MDELIKRKLIKHTLDKRINKLSSTVRNEWMNEWITEKVNKCQTNCPTNWQKFNVLLQKGKDGKN